MATLKEMERELKRLQKLVFYDELTGLRNRRGFNEDASALFKGISSVWRHKEPKEISPDLAFSIIFIDADNFKFLNDAYGHDVGDVVLRSMGKLLKKTLRPSDVVGRWGGEEFVIALFGSLAQDAPAVAERIRKNIESLKLPQKDSRRIKITASIGVANYAGEEKLDELIKHADEAMYQAKRRGKNQVILHKESFAPIV